MLQNEQERNRLSGLPPFMSMRKPGDAITALAGTARRPVCTTRAHGTIDLYQS
jgi:hypothetical protein